MSLFIILNFVQAAQVRGPSISNPASALEPIERAGSKYILGVGVLADSAHTPHWALLGSLSQLDQSDPAFPAPINLEGV